MRIVSLFLIAGCSILSVASGLKSPWQHASSTEALSSSSSMILKVRGGAGPLDPTLVAKTATALVATQGLVNVLCTEASLKAYGVASASEEDVIAVQLNGFTQLSNAISPALLLFYGTDVNTALAYGLVPFIISFAAGLINDAPKKFGTEKLGNMLWLIVDSALMYGLLNKSSWATDAFKGICVLAALSHTYTRLNPKKGMELYGRKKPLTPFLAACMKGVSDVGLCGIIQGLALISGVGTLTSIGYAYAFYTVPLLFSLFLSNDFQELKLDRSPWYFWLAVCVVVVGTLNF